MDITHNPTYQVMEKSLDAMWMRQEAIAQNIANLDTPGYKKKYVDFESALVTEMEGASTTQELYNNLNTVQPVVMTDSSTSIREDGNNVDLDEESLAMVDNQIQYTYMVRMFSDDVSRLRYAITEGSR